MGILKEIPVTAGFPLKLRDIFSLADKKNRPESLEEDFKNYLGVDYARVTHSGTAALYIILEAIKGLTCKRTVVIPSYSCPLVPLAIKRAGFNIEICDITGYDFNYNIGELNSLCSSNNDIAAVLAIHLAGIPVDLDSIEKIARINGSFLIEDCALSLGAAYKGKKTGILGDFSFFSLCRGKGVTMYEGGVLVTRKGADYGDLLDEAIKKIVRVDPVSEGIKILELLGYGIFYRPQLFWFVFRLPRIFWNAAGRPFKAWGEEYGLNFSTHRVSGIRKRIAHSMFLRSGEEIEKRRKKASYYIEKLKNIRGITLITEPVYAKGSYPYVVVLFSEHAGCTGVRKRFSDIGLGVSELYSEPINEFPFLKSILPDKACKNTCYVAHNNITLSTSDFMSKEDMDRVVDILSHHDQQYPGDDK